MNKKNNIIIFITIILIICGFAYLFNNVKNNLENKLENEKNEIYFNTWFYMIKIKNDMGKLLQFKDPELGYRMEYDTKYKVSESINIKLKDIGILLKYIKKNKTLAIYLDIWDRKTGKNIGYSDMPNEVLKEICSNIISILYENLLIAIEEKNSVDITKNYIDYIEFNFNIEPNENGYSIGVITYKRNEKNSLFSFDFLKESKINECIVNCDKN